MPATKADEKDKVAATGTIVLDQTHLLETHRLNSSKDTCMTLARSPKTSSPQPQNALVNTSKETEVSGKEEVASSTHSTQTT
mmetsp:Transcript_5488/g.7950  ORF Transcript_5488/g.7950 Transcript_5488/m.7950 type:complete len:82 (-) Transcript_5488:166-411(-)